VAPWQRIIIALAARVAPGWREADSTMTTGAPLDARRAAMPSYILERDGICSQHEGELLS